MKRKFLFRLVFGIMSMMFLTPGALLAQDTSDIVVVDETGTISEDDQDKVTVWDFVTEHLAELILGLLALIELIVRWTPTEKDDSWFEWLRKIIDAIFPSARKNRAGPGPQA